MSVDRPWENWYEDVARGVASVPDDTLKEAARILGRAPFVITAGNGGSASLASHAAQALLKPDYAAGGGRPTICLTDCVPTLTAHANDGGWEGALEELARPFLPLRPALLLISSSGKSRNIVRLALSTKTAYGDLDDVLSVVALTGFDGGPLRDLATVSVHVDSHDYEVVEPVHDALLHRIQYHLRRL